MGRSNAVFLLHGRGGPPGGKRIAIGDPRGSAALASGALPSRTLILAGGTEAAVAAKQATSTIPIVFPTAGDPIGSRLVASLRRPGGNVTGLSNLGTDLAAKRPATSTAPSRARSPPICRCSNRPSSSS
jgi:ABC transporter substrate binding protein